MPLELPDLIATIKRIKSTNQFKRYIDFIHFPFYRNLDIDTTIRFNFPLTVFIGQNGCGKSSCLHAMYGAPKNYSPYNFWFDTKVDPITYFSDEKKRHSFWYSFKNKDNEVKEVIKARIKRNNDPNYWETSRPLAWAGMSPRADSKRDKPIIKEVVYIDFREELSAFDKFFYFGNVNGLKSKTKQEFIRRKSISLQKVLSGDVARINTNTGVANEPVRNLNEEEIKWTSYILGKEYISGQFVEHSFFRNKGYSVIFNTNHAKYSEAFAGSGEVAVVRLVLRVLDANDYSLILLDEPEVSLHPGAQSRLKIFLLQKIKHNKHQVIITSHSPSIIKGLPKEAIKVFYQNPNTGRFLVKENLTPEEAFYHIEFSVDDRKNIIVEDILAREIVTGVLAKMGVETQNLFNVKYNPGGESVIKKEFASVFCRETNAKDFIVFDGDQKPDKAHYNWRNFPTSSLTIADLKVKIKEQIKEDIKFSVDGGEGVGNQDQQLDLLKKYMDYFLNNVFYLPKKIPEDIIWSSDVARNLINITCHDKVAADAHLEKLNDITNMKKKFALIAEITMGDNNSENIASIHKQFIQNWLNRENEDFNDIKATINLIVHR
jgi:predicted ATPase